MSHDEFGQWQSSHYRPIGPSFCAPDSFTADTTLLSDLTHDELVLELQRMQHENQRLGQNLRQVRAQNAQLRERLSERASARPGAAMLDDAMHATLADRFRDLVQQDMQHVVRQSLGARRGPGRIAYEIRALCQELLMEKHDPAQTCIRLGMDPATHATLLRELITKVGSLTKQITADVWDFSAIIGECIDPDIQRPWGQCEAHHPIQFVVAPGYRANGRTYAPQLVFTSPKSRWRR